MKTLQEGLLDVGDNIRAYGTMVNLYDVIKDHIVRLSGNRSGGLGYTHVFDIKKSNAFIKRMNVPVLDTTTGRFKSQVPKEFIKLCSAIFKATNFIPSTVDNLGRIPVDTFREIASDSTRTRSINPDFGIYIQGNRIRVVWKWDGEIDAHYLSINEGTSFVLDKNFDELL